MNVLDLLALTGMPGGAEHWFWLGIASNQYPNDWDRADAAGDYIADE